LKSSGSHEYSHPMRAPIRPIRGAWPAVLERRFSRFFWIDPRVVLDDAAPEDAFRTAMAAFHVGGTIKITGAARHRAADALILEHVELTDASIVDIGASDGSTSVDLIKRLPTFKSYIIADLFLRVTAVRTARHVLFYGPDEAPILIVGPRAVAWPSLSSTVRVLYRWLEHRARRVPERTMVLLLNPTTRALIAADPRVAVRVHDIFQPWTGPRPNVMKVANLLRRLYFSDTDIVRALLTIRDDLNEGGYLLVVDNPRLEGIDERAGLYRRTAGRFVLIAQTEHAPEIAELVLSLPAAAGREAV
jgi:hypothetical protein